MPSAQPCSALVTEESDPAGNSVPRVCARIPVGSVHAEMPVHLVSTGL